MTMGSFCYIDFSDESMNISRDLTATSDATLVSAFVLSLFYVFIIIFII